MILDIILLVSAVFVFIGSIGLILIVRDKYREQHIIVTDDKEELRGEINKILQPINADLDVIKTTMGKQVIETQALIASENYTSTFNLKKRGRPLKKILVTDIIDNSEHIYDSIEEFARDKMLSVNICKIGKYKNKLVAGRYYII